MNSELMKDDVESVRENMVSFKMSQEEEINQLTELQVMDDNHAADNGLIQNGLEVCSNSSLLRSECGQFFLVTMVEDKVVSKHQINLQFDGTEDFMDLNCSGPTSHSSTHHATTLLAPDLNNSPSEQVEERPQAGDTLQLAMQEIVNDVSLLEPVSYEVKLAAMNAMIPKDVVAGMSYDCPICSSTQTRLSDLKIHLSRHFGLSLYLCSFCGRQFSNSSNLIRHVRIHSGDKPYKCKDCGKRFNQANGLATHREYLHPSENTKHTCPVCGRQYKSLQLLKRHCKTSHQDENFELNPTLPTLTKRHFHCSDCGESFDRKHQLQEHREQQHASIPVQNNKHHPTKSRARSVRSSDEKNETNEQTFDNIDSIDSMLREIQDENNLLECVESGDIASGAKVNDTIHHTIEEVIDKVNRFICLECGKQYQRYLSYKQHWGVHETSLRKFECQECGLTFAWKSTYVKHVTQSHSSAPLPSVHCTEPDCDKEYKSLSQLQEHIKRDHRMIRRFECNDCKKQFYKAHDLLVHKRTHSQEKPYMCGHCGKAFSHLSHVIRHEKSHNNIRPYECKLCLKSFTQATVLRAHRCKKRSPSVETPEGKQSVINVGK